jgi:hypothetical protein
MRNFKCLILFLVAFLSFSGLTLGQKKTPKNTKKTAKPTIKTSPENTTQPTTQPVVQETPQPDQTSTKKNERPGDSNSPEVKTADDNAKTNSRATSNNTGNPVYFYEFTQPNFLISKILIEHDEQGKGKITFLKKEYEEEISDPVQLTPATLERIKNAYAALNFLDSTEDYQYEKDYSHLGNMKFTIKKDGRERTAKFNWTQKTEARALADEYRKVGQQYVWMFEINLARENQPLNAPRLMDALDAYVRRNEISDPPQMIPFLKQLSNDERIPLIARNHATRLIKDIEKKAEKAKK